MDKKRSTVVTVYHQVLSPFRRVYYFFLRPKTFGVKMLIQSQETFLFIRNSYGNHGWTVPGGGKKRKEKPEEGAIREAREEVGIEISAPMYIGSYYNTRKNKRDTVFCFLAKVDDSKVSIDQQEVAEYRWFKLSEIPKWHSQSLNDIIHLYESAMNNVPRGTKR